MTGTGTRWPVGPGVVDRHGCALSVIDIIADDVDCDRCSAADDDDEPTATR